MKALSSVLVALALAVPLGAIAAPAQAAGKTCVTTKLAVRCADVTGPSDSIYANAAVTGTKGRVRVQLVSVTLQYLTDAGWVTNNQTEPEPSWVRGGDSSSAGIDCSSAANGKWRSKGVMKWKLGRDGMVHKGSVTSDAVRRSRFCS